MKKIIIAFFIVFIGSIVIFKFILKPTAKIERDNEFVKDTLHINLLIKKAQKYSVLDIKEARYLFYQASEIAFKLKSQEQIAKVFFEEGNYYLDNYKIFEAIRLYNKVLPVFEKLNYSKELSLLYFNLGKSYVNTYSDSKEIAFKYYSKSLNLYIKNKNEIGEANCYNGIGDLYFNKNYEVSLKYYKKALLLYRKNWDYQGIAVTYINLAKTVANNGNIKQGILFSYKALAALKNKKNDYSLALVYNSLGNHYKVLKDYDKALYFLNRSLFISNSLNNNDLKRITLSDLADVKLKQGLYDDAIEYVNKSTEQSIQKNDVDVQTNNILILSTAYENKNLLKEALKYKNDYIKIKERENKNDDRKKAQLYQNINQLEQSQFEINELTVQNEITDLKLESKRNLTYYLIFISLILIVFILILVDQQKAKRKVYDLLLNKTEQISLMSDKIQMQNDYLNELNNTKNKLLKIIAHDLKNPLSSIEGFTDLMISDDGCYNKNEKTVFLNVIKDSATKASEILNDILNWAVDNDNPVVNKAFCIYKMMNEELKLLEIQALQKTITIENQIDQSLKISTDKNKLATILRNLVSNAIKFTPSKGRITIISEVVDNFVKITIKDTGVGMSKTDLETLFNINHKKSKLGTNKEEGSGLGLVLCKDFVEKLGGTISVSSSINQGSAFSFTIPLSTI